MPVPSTSADFNRAYRAPITVWGDVRIPAELKALARDGNPRTSLELGCGVGRFTRYVAEQGLRATGVDFSEVAIEKARRRVARDREPPQFLVGDVTRLDALQGPYDISFDVGCFHCLDAAAQKSYVHEISRLLAPGGMHLIWALDETPAGCQLSPDAARKIFWPNLRLIRAQPSRRRLARSHWYWLQKAIGDMQSP